MCIERSRTTTLDVSVDASGWGLPHPGCACDKDGRGRLLPSEGNPCEWHFAFESFATPERSKRICTLDVDFHEPYQGEQVELALGACQFFDLTFPQLTGLSWKGSETNHANHTFSRSPFTPTVRSLSFEGAWDGLFTQVNNLTSLTFVNYEDPIDVETLRLFMLNNQSLESLSLDIFCHEGSLTGPPANLPNLKSFSFHFCDTITSTVVHIPALQRLSSLQISSEGVPHAGGIVLAATGDGISLLVETVLRDVQEVWRGLTRDAQPTIRCVRLCGYSEDGRDGYWGSDGSAILPLLADAHTLEVGRDYLLLWYDEFLDDLKQFGPQLKTIRFELEEGTEPFEDRGDVYNRWGGKLLDQIEELVKYRFEDGHPFSVVERMVICETERESRLQNYVWRCFYGGRRLGQYVRPE